MPKQRQLGKFWPWVRPMIWEKARSFIRWSRLKLWATIFKGITRNGKSFVKADTSTWRN